MALIAILTSVISAVYYLNIIKQVFFDRAEYKINPEVESLNLHGNIIRNNVLKEKLTFKSHSIVLSSYLTITISILTLVILLFILLPQEWLSMANILALILFNS
jgi:NADH-ubiquinone oxidoreductase chain 2